jgi:hypothetical protein
VTLAEAEAALNEQEIRLGWDSNRYDATAEHLDEAAGEYEAAGVAPDEARRLAVVALVQRMRGECADCWRNSGTCPVHDRNYLTGFRAGCPLCEKPAPADGLLRLAVDEQDRLCRLHRDAWAGAGAHE